MLLKIAIVITFIWPFLIACGGRNRPGKLSFTPAEQKSLPLWALYSKCSFFFSVISAISVYGVKSFEVNWQCCIAKLPKFNLCFPWRGRYLHSGDSFYFFSAAFFFLSGFSGQRGLVSKSILKYCKSYL